MKLESIRVSTILAATVLAGCATTGGDREPVGTATTTSARSEASAPACASDLPRSIEFAPGSAELGRSELADLHRWADCLVRTRMAHTTILLLGGDEPGRPYDLFERRAAAIREVLAARGIDAGRVVIGAPNATREGGRGAPSGSVQVEVTSETTLPSLGAPDAWRRGVR